MAQVNGIGNFRFIRMSQPVLGYRRDLMFEARTGVNGHNVWDTGERGRTFTVHTATDVATYPGARALLELYYDAQRSGDVFPVIWANLAEPRQVIIQAVEPINGTPRRIAGGVGGTYTAGIATGWLEASWRLHQVYE